MSAISCFCWFVCNCDSIVKFWGCGRLRDGLWKPDLASLHQTQGLVELNCKLWTAHRKCLFIKQTYMYFMAATLLLFYFGRQSVDISTWLQSNFLCFSSPFFFFFAGRPFPHIHTVRPPMSIKIRLLFWQWPFLFSWRCEGQSVGVVLTDSGTLLWPPGQL